MTAAALGTVLRLETFDGEREVDIPPGTQPEEIITLTGLGVGRLNAPGRGDLNVQVSVEVPTAIDEEQRELLNRLAELRGEERIEPRLTPVTNGSVFSRLRDKLAGR